MLWWNHLIILFMFNLNGWFWMNPQYLWCRSINRVKRSSHWNSWIDWNLSVEIYYYFDNYKWYGMQFRFDAFWVLIITNPRFTKPCKKLVLCVNLCKAAKTQFSELWSFCIRVQNAYYLPDANSWASIVVWIHQFFFIFGMIRLI